MNAFAPTPEPPYTAVIFTAHRSADDAGYDDMATAMGRLVAQQPGFLGVESVDGADGVEITVSYWATAEDARAWKSVAQHAAAQQQGRERWYAGYRVRVATVERDYGHGS